MPISSSTVINLSDAARKEARTGPSQIVQEDLAFLGFLTAEQRACLPNWLVIAPPKTGTSWLYANLREHPDTFVPPIKELKYFSHRFECEDLRTYLEHFRAGMDKSKGEASPSYSMLPRRTIRLLRRLIPDLKLIFVMRDPLERAWSHARHSFCQGEANFKGNRVTIDEVTDEDWIVNLDDEWNRLSGDYLGQLQRWLSVFPREQVYLGFFEDLVSSPRKLLRHVLEFLDLDPNFADSPAVTTDAVNVGSPKTASPRLLRHLRGLYAGRTAELAAYLDREFQIRVPAAWEHSFGSGIFPRAAGMTTSSERDQPAPCPPDWGRINWETDDATLARLLSRDDLLAMDFLGFNIVRRDAGFLAYRVTLGIARPEHFDLSYWKEQAASGNCFFADNPYDLKSQIVRHTLSLETPPGSMASRLRQAELEFDRLFRGQTELTTHVDELKEFVARGLEPLEAISRRQGDTEGEFAQFRQAVSGRLDELCVLFGQQAQTEQKIGQLRVDLARGLEPLDPLRRGQLELEQELARCADQLHEFQVQLRGARRRLRKLNKNRIIRALRWLDVCLPWKRPRGAAVSPGSIFAQQMKPETLGCIEVRRETNRFTDGLSGKSLLPSLKGSVISPGDCLKSTG
jgi:Sulfotransferase domain